METCKRSSGEASGTIAGQRKHSTDIQKLVIGAEDKNPDKTLDQISENVTNKLQNYSNQSRSSIRDDRSIDHTEGPNATERIKEYNKSVRNSIDKEELSNRRYLDDGNICFCLSRQAKSSGERKFDEMMDYAIQNLGEAGKALNNLGDNFEHDLKLMFMDIMTRVQHWVNVVQNRLYAAKADLESIREESVSRISDSDAKDSELIELRRKLGVAEAKLKALEEERTKISPGVTEATQAGPEGVSASAQAGVDKDSDKLKNEDAITLINSGCQCREEREKSVSRETELETELALLIEENERLIKERAEYENAIRCALLRGVSSLNVETLRVLRCPPIPCGVSTSRSASPTTRCDVTSQPVQRDSKSVGKNTKNDKNDVQKLNNYCQPISEHLLCCGGRNDQAPVLFLHHGDAASPCQPCAQPRIRSNAAAGSASARETVCVGGKCKKPVKEKEKISGRTIKSPRSRANSNDICVRNKHDFEENGATAKKCAALIAAKRCGACSVRNCRNKDD